MALPWVQIETELIEGPGLSRLALKLGLSEDEVLGKLARAWAWSLRHAAPQGKVRGQGAVRAVERAVGWVGEPGAFCSALVPEGVLELQDDLLRFCGWAKRYGKKLRELAADAERKRVARDAVKDVDRMSDGRPDGQAPDVVVDPGRTSDQTGPGCLGGIPLTSTVLSLSSDVSTSTVRDRPRVVFRVEPPTTPPDEWMGEDFWKWAEWKRQEAGLPPEAMPRLGALGSWWSQVRMVVPRVESMKRAFIAFGKDKHWQGATPPLPFAAFMKNWNKYLPQGALDAA